MVNSWRFRSSTKVDGNQVDPVSLRKLIVWIDTMCPYLGDDEIREIPDPIFQGVDWLSSRPQVKSAPKNCPARPS